MKKNPKCGKKLIKTHLFSYYMVAKQIIYDKMIITIKKTNAGISCDMEIYGKTNFN